MRILVLGGTRYIGAHAVRQLAERGHEITLFNRGKSASAAPVALPDLPLIEGDRGSLRDHAEQLRAVQAELVLDMRPISEADALAVVEVFSGHAGGLVAISSVDVYQAYDVMRELVKGSDPATGLEPVPLTEQSALRSKLYPYRLEQPRASDDPQALLDDYDKILVERVYLGQAQLPATILRLPMVYGPGDYQHRLWEYLERMLAGRQHLAIDSVAAMWRACRAYVGDVAHAICLAAEQPASRGRAYHLAETPAITERQWADRIAWGCGWQGSIYEVPAEYWPASHRCQGNMRQHWELDSSAIRRDLGYAEQVDWQSALAASIEWEKANPPQTQNPERLTAEAEDAVVAAWLSALAQAGG